MKKNVLALSITAAVMSLGMVGGAHAVTTLGGATAASTLALNGDGVGHMLLVPYFTAQAENSTLINLVNTDAVNGKAVKVRFRGASNSDDVLDFQVFLSPGDVWAANVSKGADGKAVLTTKDTTCLRPDRAAVGLTTTFPFATTRLDPSLTGDALANGTREGYVEIFNMADIPPTAAYTSAGLSVTPAANSAGQGTTAAPTTNALFTAIKHVAKVAPCGAALTALDAIDPTYEAAPGVAGIAATAAGTNSIGMLPPTSGLMANWTIINVVGAAAWSGNAVAVEARTGTVATLGNVTYFPQTGTAGGNAVAGTVNAYTADPLLQTTAYRLNTDGTQTALTARSIAANQNDLPDMSTPYTTTNSSSAQALALTKAIEARTATNEYLTDSTISASTDWVFSMPTRRYSVALNYAKVGATVGGGLIDSGVRFTDLHDTVPAVGITYAATPLGFFTSANSSTVLTSALGGRQVCVNGITYTATDREESKSTAGATLSPVTAGPALLFCGEDSVLSVNLGSTAAPTRSLKATLTQKDIDLGSLGYVDGWMTLATPGNTVVGAGLIATYGATYGLPVLGGAFMKAAAGTATFGTFYNHRFTR